MDIKEVDKETEHFPLVSPVPDREVLPAPPPEPVRAPDEEPIPA